MKNEICSGCGRPSWQPALAQLDWISVDFLLPETKEENKLHWYPSDIVSSSIMLEIYFSSGKIQHSYYILDDYCVSENKTGWFMWNQGGSEGKVTHWRYVIPPIIEEVLN